MCHVLLARMSCFGARARCLFNDAEARGRADPTLGVRAHGTRAHVGAVTGLLLLGDSGGWYMISCGTDNRVQVWDVTRGACLVRSRTCARPAALV